jgi:hypothetical protein
VPHSSSLSSHKLMTMVSARLCLACAVESKKKLSSPSDLDLWIFFISSILILQMTNTRNRVTANNAENNGENNNQDANPSPPFHLLLSKCWLCKHRCFRPCSRPWSTCMHNPKRHCRRGIGWGIFSALSRQSFLMPWSRWMLMIGSSQLRRSCKWCSATTVRRCC